MQDFFANTLAGHARQFNVIQIGDDSIITFDPTASSEHIVTGRASKNQCWRHTLHNRELFPEYEHPGFAPTKFGALAEEARQFEHATFSEAEWTNGRNEDDSCCLTFNFDRLISCLVKTKSHHLNGCSEDALSNAWDKRQAGDKYTHGY